MCKLIAMLPHAAGTSSETKLRQPDGQPDVGVERQLGQPRPSGSLAHTAGGMARLAAEVDIGTEPAATTTSKTRVLAMLDVTFSKVHTGMPRPTQLLEG